MFSEYNLYKTCLSELPNRKILINTLNAHSYNVSLKNKLFRQALLASDILLPDGIGVVWAESIINQNKIKKIAGEDIFKFEMKRLNTKGGSCFFLGSSQDVLNKILQRAETEYPNIKIGCYSPPYKSKFTEADTKLMLENVNDFDPMTLFIGMTAPKQEIWAYENFKKISADRLISVGAVFDFYAGTIKRAPKWLINLGLEWLYRLIKEPKRMWKRYLIGNVIFMFSIIREKIIKS